MRNPQQPHREGVERLAKLVYEHYGVYPLVEPKCSRIRDVPDLYVVLKNGSSLAIDWKESHADTRAHLQKPHVIDKSKGVGVYRYIASRVSMLGPHDYEYMPYWLGHLVVSDSGIDEPKASKPTVPNPDAERLLLWSAIRNLERETAKQADDARPANQNRLNSEQRDKARALVHEAGSIEPKYVARDLMVPGTKDTIQKVRSALIRDAGAGLIDGVRLVDPKTRPMLVAVETKESV